MGRKKRTTAKTGDVAIYKSRDEEDPSSSSSTTINNKKSIQLKDDDHMYNVVERFTNANDELQQDMLKFNKNGSDSDDDDDGGLEQNENVFDLGLDESSDDDDDSDSDSNSDDKIQRRNIPSSDDDDLDEEDLDDDDDDDDDESSMDSITSPTTTSTNNILNWGKRKKDYYHGDTADLEIGQDIEDAELEEEAGREVLKARMDGMTEEDFMLDDDDDEDDDEDHEKKSKTTSSSSSKTNESKSLSSAITSKLQKNISQLSQKDKLKLLSKTHPELLPLITHFREEYVRPLMDETMVVTNALFQNKENAEEVGATKAGLKYLLAKAMLQTSTALNVCQYLLLKAEYAKSSSTTSASSSKEQDNIENDILFDDHDDNSTNIKNHPVIQRLNQLNHLGEKLNDDIESQVPGLKDQIQNLVKASALMFGEADDDDDDDDQDVSEDGMEHDDNLEEGANTASHLLLAEDENEEMNSDEDDDDDDETSSSDEDEAQIQRNVMNEARFAVRPQDDILDNDDINDRPSSKSTSRKRRRMIPMNSDYGDDDDDVQQADLNKAAKSLASTVNTISQRSKKSSQKTTSNAEVQDDADEERFKRGLEMMETDLGPDFDDDDEDMMMDEDNELDDDDDDDDFYAQIKKKSKQKKEMKRKKYEVAPKYPGLEDEIEGERSVGQMIMKNRGLVAHKAKINRNPRVKKREQYRKAIIRRKGAVRDVRTDEGHKYGGEQTGIKSGLSRSRKL